MWKQKLSKKAIWIGIQILVVLILLPGCFQKEKIVYSLFGEELIGREVQGQGSVKVFGEQFSLDPGVYQVRVWANVNENQTMGVEIVSEQETFRAIRTNLATIFPGDEYIDFEVYVSDKVSTAYVALELKNTNAGSLIELDVYRTALGERLLLFIVSAFFLLLDFMMVFRRRILDGKISKKQQVVFWTLLAGILIAYYPYMTDYFYIGADTLFHWGRVGFLKDTLQQGNGMPVRVQDTWLYDHGYAVSMFYGDLFIYIPAVLMLIGFSLMTAFKLFILIMIIVTAVVTYKCLKRCLQEEYAALFGSMIYLLAPYCIFNIYSRSAIGEVTAMAFTPLIFCGLYLLLTENADAAEYKRYKWYLILGMTVIVQSHIITSELTIILMAVVCVVFWKRTFRRYTLVQLAQAVGLVLLINAWFWVPLLYMMGADTYYLQRLPQDTMQERGLLFAAFFQLLPNKGYAQTGMYACEPVHIGAGVLMLLCIYPIWRVLKKKKGSITSFWAILSAVLLLISTQYFPWNAIKELPVIGYIVSSFQFPSRWMIWATLTAAVFAGFFYKQLMTDQGKLGKAVLCVVGIVTVASSVYHGNSILVNYGPIYLYEEENMGTHSVGNGEYVLEEAEIFDIHYHGPVAEEGVDWSQYEKQGTHISIKLNNTTEELRYVELPLMGYKGYKIKAQGTEDIPYITEATGAHGDLRVAVPAGFKGKIEVFYDGNIAFHIAEIVSLVTVLILIGMVLYGRRKKLQYE